jgi:Zn-finger nucleic acid-binding protein
MTLTCTSCRVPFGEVEARGQKLLGCPGCGGRWIDDAALGAIVDQVADGKSLDALVEFEDGSERGACPVCAEERVSAWLELLRLERCARHGYWIERATLDRLLEGRAVPEDLPRPAEPKHAVRWRAS